MNGNFCVQSSALIKMFSENCMQYVINSHDVQRQARELVNKVYLYIIFRACFTSVMFAMKFSTGVW